MLRCNEIMSGIHEFYDGAQIWVCVLVRVYIYLKCRVFTLAVLDVFAEEV